MEIVNVNSLVEKYSNFIFISPHFDDAVLSCASLIEELVSKGKKVVVATVFTKGKSETITPQAMAFLKDCGYGNAVKLFSDRKTEDIRACSFLKIEFKHLSFVDAAWRTSNGKPIYKTAAQQFSGFISKNDRQIIGQISTEIKHIISKDSAPLMLIPLGIGNHADHLIARAAAEKTDCQKLYWEDYPYNIKKRSFTQRMFKNIKHKCVLKIKWSDGKNQAINFYKSQIKSLFGNSDPETPDEKFYVPRHILI